MSSIAIITARGGSKRIPKKNIREFCGKPIIAYSIEAAKKTEMFDTIMVSTDSEEIAKIALEYGADIPFYRSERTSNDFSTTSDVLLEVLGEYEKREEHYEYACCVYPTAPFITSRKIEEAMNILYKEQADLVIPVVQFSFPPQRGVKINREGYLEYVQPENETVRSQDLEKLYHDCGQFYAFNVKAFKEQNKLFMKKTIPMLMEEKYVQDIDNESDWEMAELKYKMIMTKR